MTGNRIELHGQWKRSIGGRDIDFLPVPGSYPPVGECLLERQFDCPWIDIAAQRVFLVTEGVLASAEFTINGKELGAAGPWARYRFEVPASLLRDHNVIQARVRDIVEDFGPTPGRRFDGGLVREIYIEKRPETFLEDMSFRAGLAPDFSAAECTVAVEINGKDSQPVMVELREKETGRLVGRGLATHETPASFVVEWPRLWSPEMPNLYTLTASRAARTDDALHENVGFRRIEVNGQDFLLNGRRLFLKGVCRHDFTHAGGYSPSPAEVRRELALIRQSGFNYIRLVHSPQAACVSRIAAELGIFVSEEPGTCFHDLASPAIYAPALECLKRTVKRDRNVPSIFAWLIYNECNPDTEYAVKAARICRDIDPDARLAMADCSGRHDAIKEMVKAADMTFYGINAYGVWPKMYTERMAMFTDRPIVFTEWGGGMCVGNHRLLKDLCDNFAVHSRKGETLRLAGCSFWVWADYEEHSRPRPCAIDGWTVEGLTAPDGSQRPDLQILSMMCFDIDNPPLRPTPGIEVQAAAPRRPENWRPVEIDGVSAGQAQMAKAVRDLRRRLRFDAWHSDMDAQVPEGPAFGRLMVDGIEFAARGDNEPLIIGKGCEEVVIPVNRNVRGVAVLGHVAVKGGYPASAIFSVHHRDAEVPKDAGSAAAEYFFDFEHGTVHQPLRHGIEILRANDICRWWTPEPRAPETRPAVRSVIDRSHEVLRCDLWEREFETSGMLRTIRWRLIDLDAILLLYAVSVLEA